MATPSSSANTSSSTTPNVSYRLKWNERNEIIVMQALMDFRAEKGKNPLVDVPDHEIHKYLMGGYMSQDYTQEFVQKLESLKKKLFDNKRKLAEDPSSVTPFDTGVLEGIFRNELEPSKPSEKSQGQSSTPETQKAEGNNDGQSSRGPKTRKTKD